MATRVSRLIRVARYASAARGTARVAASRVAPVAAAAAESRAARSASPRSRGARSLEIRSDNSCRRRGDHVPGLDVTDNDLESDEAIWALYENWCKIYGMERDHDEMTRRFPVFKEVAQIIYGVDGRLGFAADGKHLPEGYSVIPFKVPM